MKRPPPENSSEPHTKKQKTESASPSQISAVLPKAKLGKINNHTWGGSLDRTNTIKSTVLLWELLTLDTYSGGDAAIIVARKGTGENDCVACVIDGGHSPEGERLFKHTQALSDLNIETTHCIVSHFDLDHWVGVGTWLSKMKEQNKRIKIITPVAAKEMAKPGDYICDTEQKKFAGEHLYHEFLNYNKSEFELGCLNFKEVSGQEPCSITSICKNENSLRWHVRCKEGMGINFYTGGDGEKGLPINATILKLDHHGGATHSSNDGLLSLNRILVHLISGPGRVHNHPAPNVNDALDKHKPKYTDETYKKKVQDLDYKKYKLVDNSAVLATSIHFDDQSSKTKTGASAEYYGDILLRIYSDGTIQSEFCDGSKEWLTKFTGLESNYAKGWLSGELKTIGKRASDRPLSAPTKRGKPSTAVKCELYKCPGLDKALTEKGDFPKIDCNKMVSIPIKNKNKTKLCNSCNKAFEKRYL